MNQITTLFTGYCRIAEDSDSSNFMRANCSCTLIRSHTGRNIIVDTLTAWDGDRLREALRSQGGLDVEDIDAVICSHGHSDHVGCNYLFQKAKVHIVGNSCVSNRDKYYDYDSLITQFQFDKDIEIHRTPGHTLSCISVIVKNSQISDVVGLCGDLFECVEDIEDASVWLEAGSEDSRKQKENRLHIAELCTYIIPGHGPGFEVTPQMREKLKRDLEDPKI